MYVSEESLFPALVHIVFLLEPSHLLIVLQLICVIVSLFSSFFVVARWWWVGGEGGGGRGELVVTGSPV